ncbi:MAG: hypothetical protein IJ566_03660 [Cardiobacteriaceae bacterium]|nr:hypothetical protein [Cardiobacteriaceae bacterium]
MNGRETKKDNDLFFLCSLIAYIARKTKNKPVSIVDYIGNQRLQKIYDLADIYHSDNIDRVCDDIIQECAIANADFDNINTCEYNIPTHWDIGKVYKRLILSVSAENNINIIDALIAVYHSFVSDLIEDYNSSFYYDNPNMIFDIYKNKNLMYIS